ncbi:MAG: hypothetical protein JWP58_1089 [Hymenobacter sp.]|nr:hypothetical protein [Hymenobacter sp.]
MADFTDLPGPRGKDNQPGLKTRVFIGFEDEFIAIKGPKKTALAGDSVTIDGSHTFAQGKGFISCYTTQDTNKFKLDPVGERDGRGKKIGLEFFHPGNSKAVAEFDRQVKNGSAIVLVETPDGEFLQLGTAGLGLEILGSYDSGTLSSGRRGFTFKGEGYQNGLLFYEGDITRPDGSKINAVTGVVTP